MSEWVDKGGINWSTHTRHSEEALRDLLSGVVFSGSVTEGGDGAPLAPPPGGVDRAFRVAAADNELAQARHGGPGQDMSTRSTATIGAVSACSTRGVEGSISCVALAESSGRGRRAQNVRGLQRFFALIHAEHIVALLCKGG